MTRALVIAMGALAALAGGYVLGARRTSDPPLTTVSVHRLTDFAGLEEAPALSPDGRSVAFAAYVGDRRQVWVKLVAGGAALQLTRDDTDHESPRWAPDGAALVYYAPPAQGEPQGAIWEVPALGGPPRRIASSIGHADISHDGARLAFFRFEKDQVHLVVSSRDGSSSRAIAKLPLGAYYSSPRWSPDDGTIAYQSGYIFTYDIFAVSVSGGEPRRISREGRLLSGFSWTPDGSGIVYSSARDSTVLYLPTFNLWTAKLDGSELRQLTFGEVSYVDPDVRTGGTLVASRITRNLNIWKFPVEGARSRTSAGECRSPTRPDRYIHPRSVPAIVRSSTSRTAVVTATCGSSIRRPAQHDNSRTSRTRTSPSGCRYGRRMGILRSTPRAPGLAGTGSSIPTAGTPRAGALGRMGSLVE